MASVNEAGETSLSNSEKRVSPDSPIKEPEASSEQLLEKGGNSLEDLCSTLKQQIASSNWLEENTAEKWTNENPELAKAFAEAGKNS